MNEETRLRELVAKWRRIAALPSVPQDESARALQVCADELQAALRSAATPVKRPENCEICSSCGHVALLHGWPEGRCYAQPHQTSDARRCHCEQFSAATPPRLDLYSPACEIIEPLSEAEMAERMKAETDLTASDLAALDALETTHPNLWYYIREVGQACQLLQQENLTLRSAATPAGPVSVEPSARADSMATASDRPSAGSEVWVRGEVSEASEDDDKDWIEVVFDSATGFQFLSMRPKDVTEGLQGDINAAED